MTPLYLDHAAATPMDPRVLEKMQPYLTDLYYNPSALYLAARRVADDIAESRVTVAHYLGCRPVEVVFTAGGTEANNLAIHGIMRRYPGKKLLVSAVEHDSVLRPASAYDCRAVAVDAAGLIDLSALESAIDDDTVLISCMYANNEIGTIQPVRAVSGLVAKVRTDRHERGIQLPLYLHTDAAQATNYLDIHTSRLGVDLMTLNGGKIYGPKQSGMLYIRAGIELDPLIQGGGQEHNLRSGTENVAAIAGFAEAMRLAQDMRHQESARLQELQRYCVERLQQLDGSIQINGPLRQRLPNNAHITIPGQDNERLIMALDNAGIMAAAGSACSASSEDASHVLLAIGLQEQAARASLRFTLGRSSSRQDIDRLVTELGKLLAM